MNADFLVPWLSPQLFNNLFFLLRELSFFQIIWLSLVLMSRSACFNFIDGTDIVTWGSPAVYLDPVIYCLKAVISWLLVQQILLLNSLATSSLLFLERNRPPPVSWFSWLQRDCYHGNPTVFNIRIFLFKQNLWLWGSFPDSENFMLSLTVGVTWYPIAKLFFSKKAVNMNTWLINPLATMLGRLMLSQL